MAINGWAEEARAIVEPTLQSLGAFGQNDVPELAFLAWRKAAAAARCLDGALAGLVVLASQVLYKRNATRPSRFTVSWKRCEQSSPRSMSPDHWAPNARICTSD
jgi:hypothetical protein